MIFYFTGTGNSLYIAKSMDENIASIPQELKKETLSYKDESIGIVCPIYGHEMPAMVKEFIRRAEFNTDYLYMIMTYGANHGGAAEIAKKVFDATGKKASYINTIMMVDNFLPNFDMNDQMKQDKKIESQLTRIRKDIDAKKPGTQKTDVKNKMVHKMYVSFTGGQPETMWAKYRITDDCIGCAICAKVCPAGCIRIENQKAVNTGTNCQACYACIHACPQKAIQFDLGQPEKNPRARYRNENVQLKEIIAANNQTEY